MSLKMKIIIVVGAALALIAAFAIYVMVIESDAPDERVGNHPPHAMIEAPTEVILSQPAVFSGEESYDDDGDDLTYFWEFHDGTNTTGPVVEHTYTEYYRNVDEDTHKVNLTVSDGEYEDTAIVSVTVVPQPESDPATIGLVSDRPLGLLYTLYIVSVTQGDSHIENITYTLVSSSTSETLANGTVSEVNKPYSSSGPINYKGNYDDHMEEPLEWFTIDSEALNATEGDYFYLYHIPTGIKMGQCQLSG